MLTETGDTFSALSDGCAFIALGLGLGLGGEAAPSSSGFPGPRPWLPLLPTAAAAAAAAAASRALICRDRRQKKNAERPIISRPPTTPTTAPTMTPVFERRADCGLDAPPGSPSLESPGLLSESSELASLPEPESPRPRSPNPESGVVVGLGPEVTPPPAWAVSDATPYMSAVAVYGRDVLTRQRATYLIL